MLTVRVLAPDRPAPCCAGRPPCALPRPGERVRVLDGGEVREGVVEAVLWRTLHLAGGEETVAELRVRLAADPRTA